MLWILIFALVYTVRLRGDFSKRAVSSVLVRDALQPLRHLDVIHVDVVTRQSFLDEVAVSQVIYLGNGTKTETSARGASLTAAMQSAARQLQVTEP